MSSTWSLRKRLLRRVLLGIALSWAIGLGLAIGALNHEMGELVDESLKGSAQFVLSAYRESGGLNLPAELGDVRIRIIADGQEVLPAVCPCKARTAAMIWPDGGCIAFPIRTARLASRSVKAISGGAKSWPKAWHGWSRSCCRCCWSRCGR
ncbi:hypothetical protein QWZ10_13870 [Paracoccus cavernae]|uniref:Uncharacterized protein n=1 Tax=Paracoccus cavernae TaxID=1571207 RepID=A0ABT8D7R7_9RHOB|nr:hypothetical protein [Paracoccus cavernae]